MNKSTSFIIGILAFLFALLWQAPATVLGEVIARQTNHQVLFTASQGTLWHGSANVAISTQHFQEQIGQLQWQILPKQLLLGALTMELSWNHSAPFMLQLTPEQLSLTHLAIDMPAKIINAFVSSFNAAEVGGQLKINCDHLLLSANQLNGSLAIHLSQVNSPLTPINPLGDYLVTLTGQGAIMHIELVTVSGDLKLNGAGDWSITSGLKFVGNASASEAQKLVLNPLLHIIGNEETAGSGQYVFNIL